MRRTVRSDVDFVVTFEELQGMFDAKESTFPNMRQSPPSTMQQVQDAAMRLQADVASAIEKMCK